MNGHELKKLAESMGLGPVDVCHEAGISVSTLSKIYRDERVKVATKVKIENAIRRLAAKMQVQAAG